jgi:hypothetical protein
MGPVILAGTKRADPCLPKSMARGDSELSRMADKENAALISGAAR